ncbi:MAG TPA: hypothetical protein VN818_10350 [Gammaproteobacteria bacterium]|nr:hypothetical protein [Gammaproteobacteria bacterium]
MHAIGTAAGTNITSMATVDYSIGGSSQQVTSNVSTVVVGELINVTMAVQSPTVSVAAGASNEWLLFLVTNTGNSNEIFTLAGDSVLVGDDFDPTPSAPFIYFDTDSSGDLSPGDTPYVPGSNDPSLAADASITVLLVNDIPAGLPDGEYGRSELTVTSNTGTGAPGTVLVGQGNGGVDAVIGTSGGQDAEIGQYLIGDILLSALKSQVVLDPFGGSQPIPGATITYQVVVTATGTGTAVGVAFRDPIPTNTTYVAGSLQLNGAPLTDAADADVGAFALGPARVAVGLGNLTSAAGPQTIDFRVTIN